MELLALAKALSRVTDQEEAATWTAPFFEWKARHEALLMHRTCVKPSIQPPGYVTPTQKWWYTHQCTVRGHRHLAKLIRKQSTRGLGSWRQHPRIIKDRANQPYQDQRPDLVRVLRFNIWAPPDANLRYRDKPGSLARSVRE